MSLRFASSLQGNLGTSLDDSWFAGERRDYGEEEDIVYSDSPLAAGLLCETEVNDSGPDEVRSADIHDVNPEPNMMYVSLFFFANFD